MPLVGWAKALRSPSCHAVGCAKPPPTLRLDPHPLPLSYRHEEGLHYYNGDYHNRKRTPGCDVDVCFGGKIAVTKIRLL